MKTWRVWSQRIAGSRHNVYAAQLDGVDSLGDEILVAAGVGPDEAAEIVRGWTPADAGENGGTDERA